MFISVEDDIICNAIDCQSGKHEEALLFLREVLLSVRRNKHIVFFPAISDGQIAQLLQFLTKKEIGILNFVYKMRQDLYQLKSQLMVTVSATFTIPEIPAKNTIYINPINRNALEIYEETHLIVENILDSEFYAEIIGRNFIRQRRLPEKVKRISYYPTQGGGATISDVVRTEQKLAQHFCLIIADSDKKYKDAEEGDTAGDIRDVIAECQKQDEAYSSRQELYVLSEVCEIENLIPFEVLHAISNKKQSVFISKYKNQLSFYDMKLGLEYPILYDDTLYAEYKKIFSGEEVWQEIEVCKKKFKNKKKEFCEAVKTIPKLDGVWGTSLMRSILSPTSKQKRSALNQMKNTRICNLTNAQKNEWERIGKIVYTWCCCFAGIG